MMTVVYQFIDHLIFAFGLDKYSSVMFIANKAFDAEDIGDLLDAGAKEYALYLAGYDHSQILNIS
jgi:hypothetical protein